MKLGQKHSERTRQKMRETAICNGNTPPSQKGQHHSEVTKKIISEKVSKTLTGHKHSIETRLKQRLAKLGKRRTTAKPYISKVAELVRRTDQYIQWRGAVYTRDNYTCVWCGKRGSRLNADHIEAFSIIMNKHGIDSLQKAFICQDLWDIRNGRTLCVDCHKNTSTYGSRVKIINK